MVFSGVTVADGVFLRRLRGVCRCGNRLYGDIRGSRGREQRLGDEGLHASVAIPCT